MIFEAYHVLNTFKTIDRAQVHEHCLTYLNALEVEIQNACFISELVSFN